MVVRNKTASTFCSSCNMGMRRTCRWCTNADGVLCHQPEQEPIDSITLLNVYIFIYMAFPFYIASRSVPCMNWIWWRVRYIGIAYLEETKISRRFSGTMCKNWFISYANFSQVRRRRRERTGELTELRLKVCLLIRSSSRKLIHIHSAV